MLARASCALRAFRAGGFRTQETSWFQCRPHQRRHVSRPPVLIMTVLYRAAASEQATSQISRSEDFRASQPTWSPVVGILIMQRRVQTMSDPAYSPCMHSADQGLTLKTIGAPHLVRRLG